MAVSTGVGRRWLMTFRWSQSAGRAQSLRHRHVRRPTDCTASVADVSSRVNPGPRRSTRTWAPSVRKATAGASVSCVTSAGSGVNRSTSCVGRSTKSWASIAPPPARATCPPQRECNPGRKGSCTIPVRGPRSSAASCRQRDRPSPTAPAGSESRCRHAYTSRLKTGTAYRQLVHGPPARHQSRNHSSGIGE